MIGLDLAIGRDRSEVILPQLANPAAVRFAGFRRHIVTDKGFNRGFIRTDAEDMRRDFQLVQQRLVIQAVSGKAMQINGSLWREPDFIGEARQIILPLAVAFARRDNRFAAVAEFTQRLADILH